MSSSANETRNAEVRAGTFVLLVGGAFFFTLLYVGTSSLFVRGKTYIAEFRSTGILQEQARVRFEGEEVGSVTGVRYNPATRLIDVEFRVKREDLPDHMIAVIETEGMLGLPYLSLTSRLGVPGEFLTRPDSAVIIGEDGIPRVAGMDLASLSLLLAKGGEILGKFSTITDTVGRTLSAVHAIVADPETKRRIEATLANAEALSASWAQTGEDAKVIAALLRERVPGITGQVERTLAGAERTTAQAADFIEENRPNLREAIFNARVASLGIAEAPWRLVWKDDNWQEQVRTGRAQERSLRQADTSAAEAAPPTRESTSRRRSYSTSFNPGSSREE